MKYSKRSKSYKRQQGGDENNGAANGQETNAVRAQREEFIGSMASNPLKVAVTSNPNFTVSNVMEFMANRYKSIGCYSLNKINQIRGMNAETSEALEGEIDTMSYSVADLPDMTFKFNAVAGAYCAMQISEKDPNKIVTLSFWGEDVTFPEGSNCDSSTFMVFQNVTQPPLNNSSRNRPLANSSLNNGKASNKGKASNNSSVPPFISSMLVDLSIKEGVEGIIEALSAHLPEVGCSYYSSVENRANLSKAFNVDPSTLIQLLNREFFIKNPNAYIAISLNDENPLNANIFAASADSFLYHMIQSDGLECDPSKRRVFRIKPRDSGNALANAPAPANALANNGAPLANTGAPLDVVQQYLLDNPNIGSLFAGMTKIGCMPMPVPVADFHIPIEVITTEGLPPHMVGPGSYIGLNYNESTNQVDFKTQPPGSYAPGNNPLDDLITTLPMTQCSASTYTVYKNVPNGFTPSGGRVSRRAHKKRRFSKKNRKAKRITRKMRKARRSTKSRK